MSRPPVLAAALLALAACAAPRTPSPSPANATASIVATLEASAEAWNRGDLDGFLKPYLDSSETTFMTARGVIHGLDTIRARYRAGYFKSGGPPQLLRFGDISVRDLGPDHALMTGRYRLTDRATGAPADSGNFTLVWRRTPGGWKIIHDHSSAG